MSDHNCWHASVGRGRCPVCELRRLEGPPLSELIRRQEETFRDPVKAAQKEPGDE